MDSSILMQQARQAREKAYAPYSGFAVGAAVLAEDGRVYTGCNVENASYGLCMCAERTAVGRAVSVGARRISAVAIAGGPAGEATVPCPPCGACRQVLHEFGDDGLKVLLETGEGGIREFSLRELLPHSFTL